MKKNKKKFEGARVVPDFPVGIRGIRMATAASILAALIYRRRTLLKILLNKTEAQVKSI